MRQDAGGSQVLPVSTNPIANTSTVQVLTIDSVLVETAIVGVGWVVEPPQAARVMLATSPATTSPARRRLDEPTWVMRFTGCLLGELLVVA